MKIKKILISQPEATPAYKRLATEYKLDLTFFKFFDIVGYTASEFRKTRIHFDDYTAVIFISKHAVDNFFRLAKELRVTIPDSMKYFCSTEQVAYYLRNYIQYRKRKIFFGEHHFADVVDIMTKHREEKFLLPCSDEKQTEYTKMLDKAKFKYMKAPMYRNVPKDLTHFDLADFDMIVLFSPIGVRSLLQSFPDVKEENITVAAFGSSTHAALNAAGIKLTVAAPTKSSPSMSAALENYILGKQQEAVVVAKPSSMKSSKTSHSVKTTGVKKTKSVFASKTKYKQLMEEKKAKAAARRAERAAEKARKEAEGAAQAKKTPTAKNTGAE
ncbi:MAG: uroporphyrinogen-III synthase [Bacteroidales bacterium]|nr:uroporphyrinogen-III synthase [Bacteroidales bacterium]